MKNFLNGLTRILLIALLLVDRTPFLSVYAGDTFNLRVDMDGSINQGCGVGQYDYDIVLLDTLWNPALSNDSAYLTELVRNALLNLNPSVILDPSLVFTLSDTKYTSGGSDIKDVCVDGPAPVVNLPAVANDDVTSTNEDTPKDINVLSNDTDAENDVFTVISVTNPANGTTSINPDGTIHYVPDLNFHGTDYFNYTITGGDTAQVTVTVNSVDDLPVANDDLATTDEDAPIDIDVLANDTDVENDPITIEDFTDGSNGIVTSNPNGTLKYTPNANFYGSDSFTYTINGGDTATVYVTVKSVLDPGEAVDDTVFTDEDTPVDIDVLANDIDIEGTAFVFSVTQPTHGVVVINSDGTVKYSPSLNYNGDDSFTYTLDTGDTATVNVTVNPIDDAPVAFDDAESTNEDQAIDIDVLANDTDIDGGTKEVQSVGTPLHGTAVINSDGTVKYTPSANYNGDDSFTYTLNGGSTATVFIKVLPVNDAPVANDDSYNTNEDTYLIINAANGVLSNDTDPEGDALTATLLTNPSHGTLVVFAANGRFRYMPNLNFNGTDTFTYKATDTSGAFTIATVTINVNPVNDRPDADPNYFTTNEDTILNFTIENLLSNDSDAENDPLTITNFTQPGAGTLTLDGNMFTFTPNLNYFGVTSFNYTISDGNGGTDTTFVLITVRPINDNPVAVDDVYNINEDEVLVISSYSLGLLSNDYDIDSLILYTTLFSGGEPANGTVDVNLNGTFTYTPNANFTGVDTFVYRVRDLLGGSDLGTVTINVLPVNDAPIANPLAFTVPNAGTSTGSVTATDIDVPADTLTYSLLTPATNGTATVGPDGVYTYLHDGSPTLSDSFEFQVSDGFLTSTATVTITVLAINLPPIAIPQTLSVATGGTLGGTVTGTDPEGLPLSFSLLTGVSNGSLVFNVDGTFTYIHNGGISLSDSFLFEVFDGVHTSNALVTITVIPPIAPPPPPAPNGAPVVVDGLLEVSFEEPSSGSVSGSDPDGDPITFSLVSGPTNGTIVFNPDGTFTYTPNDGFDGSDSFTFIANDGEDDSNVGTFTLNVSEEEIVVVEEEETPLVALPFDWFSWLIAALAGIFAWLLAFLRPNMKYTLTDKANNQKVIRRRLSKPDEKTMLVELSSKDMIDIQTIEVEFYKRLAKHCGDVTVNFQLNGKLIHSVIIPANIDDSFETLIRL
jgi:hypothetical protein